MTEILSGFYSTIMEHPLLTLLIFVAATSVIFYLFSEDEPGESLAGVFAVIRSYVSTPFDVLRKALRMFRDREQLEAPYVGTFAQVAYRANRFLYLAIFITSLLIFSAGLSASLIALYPAAEIERRDALGEQLSSLRDELKEQKKAVADAGKPGYAQTLKETEKARKRELDAASAEFDAYVSEIRYTSPMLERIKVAENADALDAIAESMDEFFSTCPDGVSWREFTQENCDELKGITETLAGKRRGVIERYEAHEAVAVLSRDSASALLEATQRAGEIETEVGELEREYDEASLANAGWVSTHLTACLTILLTSLLTVLVYVWAAAIVANLMSWLIMMMMSLERTMPGVLSRVRDVAPLPTQAGSGDGGPSGSGVSAA